MSEMEKTYCQCDLHELRFEMHNAPFRRIQSWRFCPYCGNAFNPNECPLHKQALAQIKICGGIAGSEIIGYSTECRICGFKPAGVEK